MLSILNISNQTFKVEEVPDIKVEKLVQLAKQNQPRLFVVHDPAHCISAVVIPERVLTVVKELKLPGYQLAADVGLMGVLRQRQITVTKDQSAQTVARMANLSRAEFVIVRDQQHAPSGLFIPHVVAERLPHTRMVQEVPYFQKTIEDLLAENNLIGAISQIEKRIKDFHSERINLDAPDPYICGGDNEDGPHNRNSCPCPYHPGAPCAKREVLTRP